MIQDREEAYELLQGEVSQLAVEQFGHSWLPDPEHCGGDVLVGVAEPLADGIGQLALERRDGIFRGRQHGNTVGRRGRCYVIVRAHLGAFECRVGGARNAPLARVLRARPPSCQN